MKNVKGICRIQPIGQRRSVTALFNFLEHLHRRRYTYNIYGVGTAGVDGGCTRCLDAVTPRTATRLTAAAASSAAAPPGAGAHHVPPPPLSLLLSG